jgi:hypothetical protein
MSYDGKGLTPLFYSEISSSHLLYDIFDKQKAVAAAFIKEYYDIEDIETDNLLVIREKSYPSKGSIDLFLTFNANNRRCALLIETKVHDYSSVTDYQINRYYQAVSEDQRFDEIYFIYLTQFNKKSNFGDARPPRSLDEAKRGKELIGKRFRHLTWDDVHTFLEKHLDKFSKEQLLMIELQRNWIKEKEKSDLADNTTETGGRSFEYYLGDVSEPLTILETLGRKRAHKLEIDLTSLDDSKRDQVLEAIQGLANSETVNREKQFHTEEQTMKAAVDFLSEMVDNNEWDLLRFYAGLFHFTSKTSYLKLNGIKDFSIKLEVIDKSEISLCTLRSKNKLIEFSLKR